MDGEFSFTAAELDRGGKTYRFALTARWLSEALAEREPEHSQRSEVPEMAAGSGEGEVTVRASRSDKEVIVHGHVSGNLQLPCARCLQPYEQPLRAELSALYVPQSRLAADLGADYEFTAAEAEVEAYDGETVILDSLVLDSLLLEVPMIPLCSAECPGMSADAVGSTEPEPPAVDPRLLPLLRFKGSA